MPDDWGDVNDPNWVAGAADPFGLTEDDLGGGPDITALGAGGGGEALGGFAGPVGYPPGGTPEYQGGEDVNAYEEIARPIGSPLAQGGGWSTREGSLYIEFHPEEWEQFFEQADPARVRRMASMTLDDIAKKIRDTMKKYAPKDTGALRDSIAINRVSEDTIEVGSPLEYAAFVEYGTAPHFPPVEAVGGWADRHGMSPWALAFHIARQGTHPHPYIAPTIEEMEAYFQDVDLWGRVFGEGMVATLGRQLSRMVGATASFIRSLFE